MKKLRPDTLPAKVTKIPTGFGNLYITITEVDGQPFEVFCTIGKSGASTMAKAEVTGRLTSLALRNGISVEEIVEQLIDISGEKSVNYKKYLIKSIPDAVGIVLRERYLDKEEKDEGA